MPYWACTVTVAVTATFSVWHLGAPGRRWGLGRARWAGLELMVGSHAVVSRDGSCVESSPMTPTC